MFTGIIETLGTITDLQSEGSNLHLTVRSSLSSLLKIDQSIAHNGVCLTVVALDGNTHTVTAIKETLDRSSLGLLEVGNLVNLERCMQVNARIDGHFVQGHVDTTAVCTKIEDLNGSWQYHFSYKSSKDNILVDKGSICIDGTSLTLTSASDTEFSVAIIPYTYENTLFKRYRVGTKVNLEFDIIGKYLCRLFNRYQKAL